MSNNAEIAQWLERMFAETRDILEVCYFIRISRHL